MNRHPLTLPTQAALALLTLAACGSPAPEKAPPPSPVARYLVGADPSDDPCVRIVSAIGYAEPLLVPAGEEDTQEFSEGVRGRLAYVHGVVLEYGPRLPRELLPYESVLTTTTDRLSPAATPFDRQVRALKEYRAASAAVKKGCPAS
ncbi:hypothetical protein [Microbispora hainanensis]|uniref:Uncharacterized protein n=1 Tax=Microbispora hainanensis TaxID=568844 RepID=A0A544Z1F0_9ACTN|nr:hypothetical protein [Microbispora hainanensis]TQS22894.1 hypothetical protein FLX08_06010 [Microbispora hainanensis]